MQTTTNTPDADEALRVSDLLRFLRTDFNLPGLTYWRVWKSLTEGRVPAHRRGREWRVERSDLDRVAGYFRDRPGR